MFIWRSAGTLKPKYSLAASFAFLGPLVGAGARVDVAGLVASTLRLNDNDFLAGRYRFSAADGDKGAVRNEGALSTVEALKLRSMMWNIDSMDWADPVPKSIAERVLHETAKAGRGVILFHDIQGRTVQALPLVLDQLVADGWRFATWHRRQRKRDFRRLWIIRINAAARQVGVSYSKLVHALSSANIDIDRKILADLAISDPTAFRAVLKQAGLTASTSEALRMIDQGGVRLDGDKVVDKGLTLSGGVTAVLQVGKRKFARITLV